MFNLKHKNVKFILSRKRIQNILHSKYSYLMSQKMHDEFTEVEPYNNNLISFIVQKFVVCWIVTIIKIQN